MEINPNTLPNLLKKQDKILEILDKLVKQVDKKEEDIEEIKLAIVNINETIEKRFAEKLASDNNLLCAMPNVNFNTTTTKASFDDVIYKKYFTQEIFESFFGEVTKQTCNFLRFVGNNNMTNP
jgi:restriction endonuclease S subunit